MLRFQWFHQLLRQTSSSTNRVVLVLLAFLFGASPLFCLQGAMPSQTPAPAPRQGSQAGGTSGAQDLTKLKVSSDLVLIPVIVTDKSGKPVAGLQKETFTVEENGKARAVSVFEEMNSTRRLLQLLSWKRPSMARHHRCAGHDQHAVDAAG